MPTNTKKAAAANKTNPLLKIVFIDRVAKFSCRSYRQILKLCYVNEKEWRTAILSYSLISLLRTLLAVPPAEIAAILDSDNNSNTILTDVPLEDVDRLIASKLISRWRKVFKLFAFLFRRVSEANTKILFAFKKTLFDYLLDFDPTTKSEVNELLGSQLSDSTYLNDNVRSFVTNILQGRQFDFAQWMVENEHNPNLLDFFFPTATYGKIMRAGGGDSSSTSTLFQNSSLSPSEQYWTLRLDRDANFYKAINKIAVNCEDESFADDFTPSLQSIAVVGSFLNKSFARTKVMLSRCARHGRLDLIEKICDEDPAAPYFAFGQVRLFEETVTPPIFKRICESNRFRTLPQQSWDVFHAALDVAQKHNHADIVIYILEKQFKDIFTPDSCRDANEKVSFVNHHRYRPLTKEDEVSYKKEIKLPEKESREIFDPKRKQGSFSWNEILKVLTHRDSEANSASFVKSNVLLTTFRRAIEMNQVDLVQYFMEDMKLFTSPSQEIYHHVFMRRLIDRKYLAHTFSPRAVQYPGRCRGGTPLLLSIECGSFEVFEYLLEYAQEEEQSRRGRRSQNAQATSSSSSMLFVPVTELYAQENATIPRYGFRSRRHENPLLFCCHIHTGVRVKNGRKPSSAAFNRDFRRMAFEMAKQLIEVTVDGTGDSQQRPRFFGPISAREKFMNHDSASSFHFTPLHVACALNCSDLARLFIYFGAHVGNVEQDLFYHRWLHGRGLMNFVGPVLYHGQLYRTKEQIEDCRTKNKKEWKLRIIDVVEDRKRKEQEEKKVGSSLWDDFKITKNDPASGQPVGFRRFIGNMTRGMYRDRWKD